MTNIQFNLLPDVKETIINTQRNRKTVITICFMASIVSLAIFILVLFSVEVVQKAQLAKASNDAKGVQNQLKSLNGLPKILTVQNQLQTLAGLHQSKPAVSRIFTYMPQLTPASANIGSMTLDMAGGTLNITGSADSQATVNTFVDTLKFAVYKANDQDTEHPAFSNVTLNSFSITPGNASYVISAVFDPALFANPLQTAPSLIVKNQVTTRSVLDDPATLFKSQPAANTGANK
jgi:Tfp pilus assembly protein PilN